MPELTVVAQALWDRAGPAPLLTVTDDPERWCAVELAVAPENLVVSSGAASWASWQRGMVRPGPIAVPDEAWSVLRSAQRVYYRAHSSASERAWVQHRVTVSDLAVATAPSIRLCDVWTSGARELLEEPVLHVFEALNWHPELRAIIAEETVAVLVCLHRFSPKRPVDRSQLELLVLLAGSGADRARILVQRLAYLSLAPIAAHVETVPGSLAIEGQGPGDPTLRRLVGQEAVRWPRERLGPFLILRNNGPEPDEEGGTCVVVTGIDRCVYFAKTNWSGGQEVVLPA